MRRDEASERDLWRYCRVQIDAAAIYRLALEFIECRDDVAFRGDYFHELGLMRNLVQWTDGEPVKKSSPKYSSARFLVVLFWAISL